MATIKFLLALLCIIAFGSNRSDGSDLLRNKLSFITRLDDPGYKKVGQSVPRSSRKLIALAEGELWVREKTGNNDGDRVEEYLRSVGLVKGQPWCAAFVCFIFKEAGYAAPRTGWSPGLFPAARLAKAAEPGNVFGIYFPAAKRIAHCGFVAYRRGDLVGTIEGNTNPFGSREGDGVYRRIRHMRGIHSFAGWARQGTAK